MAWSDVSLTIKRPFHLYTKIRSLIFKKFQEVVSFDEMKGVTKDACQMEMALKISLKPILEAPPEMRPHQLCICQSNPDWAVPQAKKPAESAKCKAAPVASKPHNKAKTAGPSTKPLKRSLAYELDESSSLIDLHGYQEMVPIT